MQKQVQLEDELNRRRCEDSSSISPTVCETWLITEQWSWCICVQVSPGSVGFGEAAINKDDVELQQNNFDSWGGLRPLEQLQVNYLNLNN